MDRIDLAERVAVMTGGAGGVGLAIADRLTASGATVTVWDVSDEALTRAKSGRDALRVARLEMLDADAVSAAMASVAADLGRLDIVVNCAGKEARRASVADYDIAEWCRSVEINPTATFIACKFAVWEMQNHDYSRIGNLSSTSGRNGNPFDSPFAAAKAGVMGFPRAQARNWRPPASA